MATIHTFGGTGEAYGAVQCCEHIRKGDILLIVDEKVIGLADTWPFAVTVDHGELHGMQRGFSPEAVFSAEPRVIEHLEEARDLCRRLGWPYI